MAKVHEIKIGKQTKFVTTEQLNRIIERGIPYEKVGEIEV